MFFCFGSHRGLLSLPLLCFFNGKLKTDGKRQHFITFKQRDSHTPQCYKLILSVAQVATLSRSPQQLVAPVVHQQCRVNTGLMCKQAI